MSDKSWVEWLRWGVLMTLAACTTSGVAQEAANRAQSQSRPLPGSSSELSSPVSLASVNASVRALQEQVSALQATVAGLRSDWQQARAETVELRRELDEVRTTEVRENEVRTIKEPGNAVLREAIARPATGASAARLQNVLENALPTALSNVSSNLLPTAASQDHQPQVQSEDQKSTERQARLDEEYQLLSGKVDDQYQTKVESASKYRLRVSGIVLLNLFSNQGVVDNVDLPMLAYERPPGDSGGSFGATLRQSEIGFETFGPTVAGAKTRADLQLDLAGGFPSTPNGINSGLMRLRTATMRMDWTNTSVVVGQDELFFSPNSPTSFATLAVPALSGAGNLWAWVPQIRVEHRVTLGEDSSLLFQGGILDPVTGESPGTGYYRLAGPGEESRQPAYASRIAWTHNIFGQPLRLGVAGYYSRQDYGFGQNVNGWAGMTDIELPLNRQFSLSGELFRGRALGGFYGGIGQSVLFDGTPGTYGTEVQALDSIGGWAQLKYRPSNKWEFNAAFGMDNPYASDLKYFEYPQSYGGPVVARNQAGFVNMIYRPRSDLLFSAEYRHLNTNSLMEGGNSAGHLNLMMGVLF
jgi:hypothetical protein